MKNWKTTIFGTGAAICATLIPVFPQYKAYLTAASTILGILFALFSKDNNVTGGTVRQ